MILTMTFDFIAFTFTILWYFMKEDACMTPFIIMDIAMCLVTMIHYAMFTAGIRGVLRCGPLVKKDAKLLHSAGYMTSIEDVENMRRRAVRETGHVQRPDALQQLNDMMTIDTMNRNAWEMQHALLEQQMSALEHHSQLMGAMYDNTNELHELNNKATWNEIENIGNTILGGLEDVCRGLSQ